MLNKFVLYEEIKYDAYKLHIANNTALFTYFIGIKSYLITKLQQLHKL